MADQKTIISNVNGVPWYEAPLPRRWHRCWPQTTGLIDGELIDRCPCGAIRTNSLSQNGWFNRNESRKARKRRR